jgi:SAM-dependent methyltransferase
MTFTANPIWNPWINDRQYLDLYRRRCRQEAEEMTCAAQAAEILAPKINGRETLLDAGCGPGYYYWSFANRNIPIDYYGLDYTPELIDMARKEICPRSGLPTERFQVGAFEDLSQSYDNIICFNVLTFSPHYGLPLQRLLDCTRKRIIIRESMGDQLIVRYTPDTFLDPDKRHIRVYHNTYPLKEMTQFMESNGFRVTPIFDRRSQDKSEMVVGIPHYWKILMGERAS